MKKMLSIILAILTMATLAIPALASGGAAASGGNHVVVKDVSMMAGQTTVTTEGGYTLTLDQPVLKAIDNFDPYVYMEHAEGSFSMGVSKQPMHYIMKPGTKFTVTDSNGKDASDKVFMTYDRSEYRADINDDNFEQFLVKNPDCSIRNHFNYAFIQESENTYARFRFIGDYNTKPEEAPKPDLPTDVKPVFTDVPANAYYKEAVDWAVENGITLGTSNTTFSPGKTCTHGEIQTMIWRACGKPEYANGVFSNRDTIDTAHIDMARQWVKNYDAMNGRYIMKDETQKQTPCTRMDVTQYLWRLSDSPDPTIPDPFTDIPYLGAVIDHKDVRWCVENGITSGTSATTFSPNKTCTRAEIVTFLYRYFNNLDQIKQDFSTVLTIQQQKILFGE